MSSNVAYPQFPAITRSQLRINAELTLSLLVLCLSLLIRLYDLNYNAIFVDEAIYVLVGEDALSGANRLYAASWTLGSYLYPISAYTVNQLGGTIALRAYSAVLGTLTVLLMFSTTRRLFGTHAALWAALIVGLAGGSVSVGQFATYDAMGIFFLAVACFYVVRASAQRGHLANVYLVSAGLATGLSFLAKYVGVIYLPAMCYLALALYKWQGKSLRAVVFFFLLPASLIIGGYTFYSYETLRQALSSQTSAAFGPMPVIQAILEEMNIALVLGVVGSLALPKALNLNIAGAKPSARFLIWILVAGVFLSTLTLPIYHLVTGSTTNLRAVEKHSVYALVLMSPLVGLGLAWLISTLRSVKGDYSPVFRAITAGITVAALVWFVNYSLDRNWGFQHSWPDIRGAVEFMRAQGLNTRSRVLASGNYSYEYYFNFGLEHHGVWQSTWNFQYKGQQWLYSQGQQDESSVPTLMLQAINNRALDFVVLDDYFPPDFSTALAPYLHRAGYKLGYEDTQILSNGEEVHLRVYLSPKYRQDASL